MKVWSNETNPSNDNMRWLIKEMSLLANHLPSNLQLERFKRNNKDLRSRTY